MRLIAALAVCLMPTAALAGLAPPPASPGWDLPEPLRSLAAAAFALQREMNGEIRQHLALLKDAPAWEPAAGLILAAFLYGVFHAIGPGHGKVVIGGWLATRKVKLSQALAACGLAAMVQAGAAIVIVGIPAGLLAFAPRQVMDWAAWLEVMSYFLITVLGLVMGWRSLRGHTCSHGHDHSCCNHDHGHESGHAHGHAAEDRAGLMVMAAAIGFRPCSGAILVLLFTLANGLFLVGIVATIAMGVGVGLTVSGIGLGALGLNRLLDAGFATSRHAELVRKGLGLAGAALITLLGVVLLAGVAQNGPQLTG